MYKTVMANQISLTHKECCFDEMSQDWLVFYEQPLLSGSKTIRYEQLSSDISCDS